jgi:hypothetical protein
MGGWVTYMFQMLAQLVWQHVCERGQVTADDDDCYRALIPAPQPHSIVRPDVGQFEGPRGPTRAVAAPVPTHASTMRTPCSCSQAPAQPACRWRGGMRWHCTLLARPQQAAVCVQHLAGRNGLFWWAFPGKQACTASGALRTLAAASSCSRAAALPSAACSPACRLSRWAGSLRDAIRCSSPGARRRCWLLASPSASVPVGWPCGHMQQQRVSQLAAWTGAQTRGVTSSPQHTRPAEAMCS